MTFDFADGLNRYDELLAAPLLAGLPVLAGGRVAADETKEAAEVYPHREPGE